MSEIYNVIVENYGWVFLVMVLIVSAVVEALKVPLKMLTSRIKSDKGRKAVNKVIILITFGMAFLVDYLASLISPSSVEFSSLKSMVVGAFSNLLYAVGEGLISLPTAKKVAEDIPVVTDEKADDKEKTKATLDAVEALHELTGKK